MYHNITVFTVFSIKNIEDTKALKHLSDSKLLNNRSSKIFFNVLFCAPAVRGTSVRSYSSSEESLSFFFFSVQQDGARRALLDDVNLKARFILEMVT